MFIGVFDTVKLHDQVLLDVFGVLLERFAPLCLNFNQLI